MRAKEFIIENLSNTQVLKYVKKIHTDWNGRIDHSILNHAEWELTDYPVAELKIADDGDVEDPYNRVLDVDQSHVRTISAQDIKNRPIVVDDNGYIIDGNHRATAAKAQGMKYIPAYVPVIDPDHETYDQFRARRTKETILESMDPEVAEFLNDLTPDDVGVDEVGDYRVHFEGFTDDCQSSRAYRRNPEKVFQEVFADFVRREGGQQPVASGMVGDEDYPILYSVFRD